MTADPTLLVKLAPLYLLVGIGFALGRLARLGARDIGALALYVLSPAVVFKGFYNARPDPVLMMLPLAVFALACLAALAALGLARARWSDGRERIAAFTAATGNTGFFGIPACLALIGPEALPYVVLVSFGATAYENSVGFHLVSRGGATWGQALGRVARYPGLHACWIGLACNLGQVPLPAFVAPTIDLLAGGFSAVGMMIVGLGLAGVGRMRVDWGFTGFAFAWKFLVWPAVAVAFVLIDRAGLGVLSETGRQVLIVESLVPMAAVTVVHAALQNVHPERAAVAVGASTLVSLAWLPLVLGLVRV